MNRSILKSLDGMMRREYSEIGNRPELQTQNANWVNDKNPLCMCNVETIVAAELPSNAVKMPYNDAVNHPSHYTQGGIECIDALTAATTGLDGIEAVCTANAIKYLWRWKHKNGVEDLKKAQFYINYLIGRLEKEEGDDKRDE